MKRISKIAASAAAAVMLTATAVPVAPAFAQTYYVEQEALAGKTDVSKLTVSKIPDQNYTGMSIKPKLTVKNGSATLTSGKDYTLSYKNNKRAGTATVTITGKGKYTGKRQETFKIVYAKKGTNLPDLKVTNRIKFMAWYDVEDKENEAQKLFRKQYGTPKNGSNVADKGNIFELVKVSYSDRLNKLTDMIKSDDSPDLFPYESGEFPYSAVTGRYQPLDSILDLSNPIWKNTKSAMDELALDGKHYCVFSELQVGSLMFYRKSVIKEAGLDDPMKLYSKNKWTWDTFLDMARAFKAKDEGNYVIDGYSCPDYFIGSTGTPLLGLEDGKLSLNVNSPEIERVADLLSTLQSENLRYPRHELSGWTVNTRAWVNGNTLFYADGGTWEYNNLNRYADKMGWKKTEIGVVPYPRDPQADKYYHLMQPSTVMWCKGSKNKNGVAAYLSCVAATAGSSAAKSSAKDAALESGWSGKNWDLVASLTSKLTPVIDMKNGIGADVSDPGSVDSNVQQLTDYVYIFGDSFDEIRKKNFDIINSRIDEINSVMNMA